MSRHGDVTFEWADGEYTFRLGLGELRRLQEKTDAGPFELLRRLVSGTWRVDDMRETIRMGLEGASLPPAEVRRLIRDYVDPPRPLLESVAVASRILDAALSGAEDEKLPKAEAKPEDAAFQTESSPSPTTTDGALSSGSPLEKSTECPSGNSEPASVATKTRTGRRISRRRRPQKNIAT